MGGFPLAGIYEPVGRRDAKVRAGCVRTNPMTTETTSPVPHHVEEAVATIAALHAAHHREARALQKAVSRATSGIAQPATLILTTVAITGWVTLNLALPEFGRAALDPVSISTVECGRFDHSPLPYGNDPHDPAPRR